MATPPGAPSGHEGAIHSEQIAAAYRAMPAICAATYVGGLCLAMLMSGKTATSTVLAWLAVLYAAQTATFVLWFAFRDRRDNDAGRWGRRIVAFAVLNGLAWGSASLVMFNPGSAELFFLIIGLFLVAVSGASGLAPYLPLVFAFEVPLIAPLIARLAYEGDPVSLVLSACCSILLALLLFYSRNTNHVILESLRMRFENLQLVESLAEHKAEERTRVLEAANRHKSEFLATMSHELRTPLNAVIGFSEVLRELTFGELNTRQARYVDNIHTSGHHLLSLINDILDLSKVEAGHMTLDVAPFDVRSLLQNCLTFVAERASRQGVAIELQVAETMGPFLADERKVKQIVLNLLSNAVKFTAAGGRVTVIAQEAGSALEVSVTDTGVGIAIEDQPSIFEAFKQVGSDYSRKREGTGLGLALTRKLVELHGGTIGFRSAPNEGSTFYFRLPGSTSDRASRARKVA